MVSKLSSTTQTDIGGGQPATGAIGHVPRSIGEALSGHSNSLGFLRLVLASIVIFDHAFPIGGFGQDVLLDLTKNQVSMGGLAVDGFFAISGYLIAKSAMSADIVQFMWRRFLRIFPAYWALLVLTAFVVIPVVWIAQGQRLATYFALGGNGPYRFVSANWSLRIGTYGIYDVFQKTTPYGHEIGASAVNGSIWTLIYEWNAYLLIAILLVFGIFARAKIVVPLVTAVLAVLQVVLLVAPNTLIDLIPWASDPYTVSLTLTFMLGSSIAVYSKKIPFSNSLGILSALVVLYTMHDGGFTLIGVPAGVYLILYLGARLPVWFHRIGSRNDYSYGVYIWGFLIEQILAQVGLYKLGYFPFAIGTLILSLGMAWLSWHVVERRAMSLKDWGPGRGIRYWWDAILVRRKRAQERSSKAATPPKPQPTGRTEEAQ
jgi:peptidoglycan/LPS O-acetylase OafA/YrhL